MISGTSNKRVQTREVLTTLDQLLDFMKQEVTEGNTDSDNILKCMNVSYPHRRVFIVSKRPPIKHVKEMYPALFYMSQILKEFGRIKNPNVVETYLENLKLCRYSIMKYSSEMEIKQLIREKKRLCNDPEILEYIETAGSVLLLPSLLEERFSDFIIFNSKVPTSESPIIICDAVFNNCLNKDVVFEVHASKIKLCETNDLRTAFLALCACYDIFHIQYQNNCAKTMAVVEIVLLEIRPKMEKLTDRVTEISKLLNQAKKLLKS